jgi:hypothetical protein
VTVRWLTNAQSVLHRSSNATTCSVADNVSLPLGKRGEDCSHEPAIGGRCINAIFDGDDANTFLLQLLIQGQQAGRRSAESIKFHRHDRIDPIGEDVVHHLFERRSASGGADPFVGVHLRQPPPSSLAVGAHALPLDRQ